MIRSRYTFLVSLLAVAVWPAFAHSQSFQVISWSPAQIASGSPCLFKVELDGSPTSVQGTWQGHPIAFFPSGEHHAWYGLAGVDVEVKPGSYKLELQATLPDGKAIRDERTVAVAAASYKTETLHVAKKFVEPDAETLHRIDADKAIKTAAFANEIAQAEWSGKFLPPIDTATSEGFGTRRTFNGKLASIHRGLDYHAKPGSPVTAANAGEVVLARELFYEGNCVMINHGQQFLTIYMHLSKLEVAAGEQVKKGQVIGLSGATGRATGPHLHMAVRWQNAYLDPAQLLALPLPDLRPAEESKVR
jgi:murein DD-endopeptidase MepM/ murein hydrolase activator NlpD